MSQERRRVLFLLPALETARNGPSGQIKYSLFPPLSLLTLAGLTPADRWDRVVRDEHVEDVELDEPFDLVAMTVYASSANRAYELSARYRARGAKVVLGGIHPTAMPDEASAHADAVCTGPAEPVWAEILCDAEAGKLKRVYRGEPKGSAAMQPAVAPRHLANPRAYLVRNTMVSSRGCPHACDFCYKSGFWGARYWEGRPLADVERELASFEGKFVFFLDDNFLAGRSRAREIFAVLRSLGMKWQAGSSIDVAEDPVFLDEAYEAGCRSLFIGIESVSRESLRAVHKGVAARADYAQSIRRIHDAGIMINGSFVLGIDTDSPDVFDRTVEFAVAHGVETVTFHIMTPYPGTRLYERMSADGRLLTRDWRLYDTGHAVFRPARMSATALEDGYHRAYEEFYTWGSIFRRSMGLANPLKRIVYNAAWRKSPLFWAPVMGLGLMPWVRPAFEYGISRDTRDSLSCARDRRSARLAADNAAT